MCVTDMNAKKSKTVSFILRGKMKFSLYLQTAILKD